MINDISSNEYHATFEDNVLNVSCIENEVRIFLPKSDATGKQILVRKTDSSANRVVVMPHRGDSILGVPLDQCIIAVEGTITLAGTADIELWCDELVNAVPEGYLKISVPLELGDTADIIASKFKVALDENEYMSHPLTGNYVTTIDINNSIVLTSVFPFHPDFNFDVEFTNGTCEGLTETGDGTAKAYTSTSVPVLLKENKEGILLQNVGTSWAITNKINPRNMKVFNLGTPINADDDRIVTSTNMAVTDYTIAAQPDVPRNITVTSTANGTADTQGKIKIYGTRYDDLSTYEEITPVSGSTVSGKVAFKTITGVNHSGWVIAAGNDTIKVGVGNVLGLPVEIAETTQVVAGFVNGTSVAFTATIVGDDGTAYALEESTINLTGGTYNGTNVVTTILNI